MFKWIISQEGKYRIDKGYVKKGNDYLKNAVSIFLDPSEKFQKHMGFGGAFTESAFVSFSSLDSEKKREAMEAYFAEKGLKYNLGRVPIHSCDFSLSSYTYVDDDDISLRSFSLKHDDARFKRIKDCSDLAGNLRLLASPRSPCGWMKSNGSLVNGGHLLKEYYGVWADYLGKFLLGIKTYGLNIAALSIQNEPQAIQTWESCIYSGEEEALFIKSALFPMLERLNLDTKVVIWDHNRDQVFRRSHEILSDPLLDKRIWGIAYHRYCSERYSNLSMVHKLYPDKHIFLSESCVELAHDSTSGKSSVAGLREHGERYAKQIINDLNNFSEGYIDRNLFLDERGGPNHVANFCEAPIMIDTKSGKINYMPSYYCIGHFSKYIEKGARRIYSSSDEDGVYSVAYLNEGFKIVIVLLNEREVGSKVSIFDKEGGFTVDIPAHSLSTFIEE
jgi:glucosylceramidase